MAFSVTLTEMNNRIKEETLRNVRLLTALRRAGLFETYSAMERAMGLLIGGAIVRDGFAPEKLQLLNSSAKPNQLQQFLKSQTYRTEPMNLKQNHASLLGRDGVCSASKLK